MNKSANEVKEIVANNSNNIQASKEEKREALWVAQLLLDDYFTTKNKENIKYPTCVTYKKEWCDFERLDDELINWALEKEDAPFEVKYRTNTATEYCYNVYNKGL